MIDLAHFSYSHLPDDLREVSKLFYDQAHTLCNFLPPSYTRGLALLKLWEAKNLAVIARLEADRQRPQASAGSGLAQGMSGAPPSADAGATRLRP
jgi:hypothetical protein